MKKWISRYVVFIIGLYFLTLGVVLIIRSSLGTSPISSLNYVLSLHCPLSLGAVTYIFNVALILAQLWFVRGCGTRRDRAEILLQLPFSLIFSVFLDFNMFISAGLVAPGYGIAAFMLLAGCIIQAVGVVLEVKPDVVAMSAEGFVKYASRRYHCDFGKFKMCFDLMLVSLAAAVSLLICRRIDGVGIGSLISAFLVGMFVNMINCRVVPMLPLGRLRRMWHEA